MSICSSSNKSSWIKSASVRITTRLLMRSSSFRKSKKRPSSTLPPMMSRLAASRSSRISSRSSLPSLRNLIRIWSIAGSKRLPYTKISILWNQVRHQCGYRGIKRISAKNQAPHHWKLSGDGKPQF